MSSAANGSVRPPSFVEMLWLNAPHAPCFPILHFISKHVPLTSSIAEQVKSLRSRLTSFYQTFAPHKLARVDAIVSSFVSRGSSPEALSHLNDEVSFFISVSVSNLFPRSLLLPSPPVCLSVGYICLRSDLGSICFPVARDLWVRPRVFTAAVPICTASASGGQWIHQHDPFCAKRPGAAGSAPEWCNLNITSLLADASAYCVRVSPPQQPPVKRSRPVSSAFRQYHSIRLAPFQQRFAG